MNYAKVLSKAVHRKWPTPELKEWWWTKFSAARRIRTARLSEAQNHRCAFCHCETYLSLADFRPGMSRKRQLATLEHVVPQHEGGTDSPSNGVMSCHSCNSHRGTMDAYAFYELRNDPERWLAWLKRGRKVRNKLKYDENEQERLEKRSALAFCIAVLCLRDDSYKVRFDKVKVAVDQANRNYLKKGSPQRFESLEEAEQKVKETQ